MTTTIHAGATIHAVLDAHPETRAVFDAFGAHACCGGDVPLAAAAERDGFDLGALLEALQARVDAGAGPARGDPGVPAR